MAIVRSLNIATLALWGATTGLFAGAEPQVPRIAVRFHKVPDKEVRFISMRFGITLPGVPSPSKPKELKRLTYDATGSTSNVCVKIDGAERLLGKEPGKWLLTDGKLESEASGRERNGLRSVFVYPVEKIEITQIVEVARGLQTFNIDTCWVRYLIENKDEKPHRVGLRFLLDTFIGTNDGAPFIIPGETTLCESSRDYQGAGKIPEFVQALESLDFKNPGVVAHLRLKLGKIEPPSRVVLCSWPDPLLKMAGVKGVDTMWNVPIVSIDKSKDSAAVLYWDEKELPAGGKRAVGFSYGLGNFSANAAGDLGIILAGPFKAGADMTVIGLVKNSPAGQTLTLRLTDGVERVSGAETQPIPSGKVSPVTWKVRTPREGTFAVGIESSAGGLHHQGFKVSPTR